MLAPWISLLLASTAIASNLHFDPLAIRDSHAPPLYRTEPHIHHQAIEVINITQDTSRIAPGYLFFAPFIFAYGYGPKIYDPSGLMIWDGHYASADVTQQFHACKYQGNELDHLCWHEASALGALRRGQDESTVHDYQRVFDNTYKQVGANYSTTGHIETSVIEGNFTRMEWVDAQPDSHEFHVVGDGSSYVQAVYYRKQKDLGAWNGMSPVGWVLESCFQEIEFVTERMIFSWCYLDHLELETHLYLDLPNATNFTTGLAGNGEWFGAWDFFHINSVDKNDEGDYLVSGRHNDQIMKIAGPDSALGEPGTALWRLGGDSNQFNFVDNWNFSRQHDARFMSTMGNFTIFSFFDNAWEGEGGEDMMSTKTSSAKIVAVNNVTFDAFLIGNYYHPEGHQSRSGGSVQILPNKNVFVGWGYIREISEFADGGDLLFHAHLNMDDGQGGNQWNYRNYKFPWTAAPHFPPKLLSYSRFCSGESAPLIAYVSWNGATEVVRWRFLVSERPGVWIDKGIHEKKEFETRVTLAERFYPHVHVEALDLYGKVLGQITVDTFVPNITLVGDQCDYDGCFNGTTVDYPAEFSCAQDCWQKDNTHAGIGLGVLLVLLEVISFFYSRQVCREVDLGSMSAKFQAYAALQVHPEEKGLPYHYADSKSSKSSGDNNELSDVVQTANSKAGASHG